SADLVFVCVCVCVCVCLCNSPVSHQPSHFPSNPTTLLPWKSCRVSGSDVSTHTHTHTHTHSHTHTHTHTHTHLPHFYLERTCSSVGVCSMMRTSSLSM